MRKQCRITRSTSRILVGRFWASGRLRFPELSTVSVHPAPSLRRLALIPGISVQNFSVTGERFFSLNTDHGFVTPADMHPATSHDLLRQRSRGLVNLANSTMVSHPLRLQSFTIGGKAMRYSQPSHPDPEDLGVFPSRSGYRSSPCIHRTLGPATCPDERSTLLPQGGRPQGARPSDPSNHNHRGCSNIRSHFKQRSYRDRPSVRSKWL